MAAARQQHHHLAGLDGADQRVGHADVFGDLDTGHRHGLGFGQQVAVATANGLLLHLPGGGGQAAVECGFSHGTPHLHARQVGTQHRNPGMDGRHHGRAIGRPRPAFFVPLQSLAHGEFAAVGGQAGGAVARIGHLQRQCGQTAAGGQRLHDVTLYLLVFRCVVLFTEQQQVGRHGRAQALCCAGL